MTTNAHVVAADAAKRLGFQLTDEGLQGLAALLAENATITPGEPVVVGTMPVMEYAANAIAAAPSWAATPQAKTPVAPDLSGLTRTARALAATQAARANAAEAKAQTARDLHATHGNPWVSSRFNRTHQAIIRSGDPVLADKLMSEAAL